MNFRGRRYEGAVSLLKRVMWDKKRIPSLLNLWHSATSPLLSNSKLHHAKRNRIILAGSFLAGVLLYMGASYVGLPRRLPRHRSMEVIKEPTTIATNKDDKLARTSVVAASAATKCDNADDGQKLGQLPKAGPINYIGLDGLAEATQLKYFLVEDGNSAADIIKEVLTVMDDQKNWLEDC